MMSRSSDVKMMAGCGGRKRLRFEDRPSIMHRGSRPRNMARRRACGVQRLGDQLRVTARIVNVETGVVLDTVMVDGRFDKIFAVQDRAGARLAAFLVSVSDGDATPLAGIAVPESQEGWMIWSAPIRTIVLRIQPACSTTP